MAQVLSVLSDGVSEKRCRASRAASGRESSLGFARIDSGDGCRRGRENYAETVSLQTNSKLVERTFIIFAGMLDCGSASARERNRSLVICVLSSLLSSPPPDVAVLAERLG